MKLSGLSQALDRTLSAVGEAHLTRALGNAAPPDAALEADHPTLFSTDALALAQEAMGATDLVEKRRGRLLAQRVQSLIERSRCREQDQAIAERLDGGTVPYGSDLLSLRQALEQLPEAPTKDRRDGLERGVGDILWREQGSWARRREAAERASERCGFSGVLAVVETLHGVSVEALVADAEAALSRSEDAFARCSPTRSRSSKRSSVRRRCGASMWRAPHAAGGSRMSFSIRTPCPF
jgi:hypothetical protein